MPRYLILFSICTIFSCSNERPPLSGNALKKQAYHFFSTAEHKDKFTLQFITSDLDSSRTEYSSLDILSGYLILSIHDKKDRLVYTHKWPVSNCFSMADNHYLNEDQKIEKFLNVVEHFFDDTHFSTLTEIKITGVLDSKHLQLKDEIESDPTSIGFSFIQEDFCVMYARNSHQAVLLRALKKDLLKKYNLL
jgi:hypothetical protein